MTFDGKPVGHPTAVTSESLKQRADCSSGEFLTIEKHAEPAQSVEE